MQCESDFGEDRGRVIWDIQAVSCLISLFGVCFILVNYFVLSQGKNPLVKLVAWLTFADLGWIVLKLTHFTMNTLDYDWMQEYFIGCVVIRLVWRKRSISLLYQPDLKANFFFNGYRILRRSNHHVDMLYIFFLVEGCL